MPSETSFCLPEVAIPNSLASLIVLTRSEPAFARAMTFAPEFCACNRNEERSGELSGCRTLPRTLPPHRRHHLRCIVLELLAERVIDRDEKPAVPALLQDLPGCAVRQRVGVPG